MNELISRHDAIIALCDAGIINYQATGNGNGMIQAINVIKALPAIDSIPISWINAWYEQYRYSSFGIPEMVEDWEGTEE